jgi:oxygen-independent coproporphyrinogen-3 oxidase
MAGLYLHIPFCAKACTYCDFHFSTSLRTKPDVLTAMHMELEQRAAELNGTPVGTIYFGGGTPSRLTDAELQAFLDQARSLLSVQTDAEVTLEVNPDDVDVERLAFWQATGITRLSIGVQSFRDERLAFMGRAHDAAQSRESLGLLADAGFTSWTMDLIYGLPGMTLEEWDEQLSIALSHAPPHISAYCLTVEERTVLDHQVRKGLVSMPGDGDQAVQFAHLIDRLEAAGYAQYEISNFARQGHHSRHNSSYWSGMPYLGIGPSAHSFDGRTRRWNVAHNVHYARGVQGGERYWEEETLTPAQCANEALLTGLRTAAGVDLDALPMTLGKQASSIIARHRSHGLIEQQGARLILTRAGRAFADRIAADLFITDDR